MTHHLHTRLATVLGWNVADCQSLSLASLRDAVRSIDPLLADEITTYLNAGKARIATDTEWRPR